MQGSRTFRIFVSSTFSDLKEERNALQKYVFPRLRELCMQHGCRFQAIDLRWGISEEAGLDQQTMKICLEEIARCQKTSPKPNFIILLGDRYGWQPVPSEIPAIEFEEILKRISPEERELLLWDEKQAGDNKGWYRRDDNAVPPAYCLQPRTGDYEKREAWNPIEARLRLILQGAIATMDLDADARLKYVASATEQEIVQGALKPPRDVPAARDHVFGFFRTIKNLDDLKRDARLQPDRSSLPKSEKGNLLPSDLIDTGGDREIDEDTHEKLFTLKTMLEESLHGNIHRYTAEWNNNSLSQNHIGRLPEDVLRRVEQGEPIGDPDTLCVDVWNRLHDVIMAEIKTIGRLEPLELEIAAHEEFRRTRAEVFVGRKDIINKVSKDIPGFQPVVVHGVSGSGKSALMAKAVGGARINYPGAVVIARFIGVTPGSSDGRSLLESLCQEIVKEYGGDLSAIPSDYYSLARRFQELLALARADRPLVVFIDALDQLSNTNNERSLDWLPIELPEHARVVVSTLPDQCFTLLQNRVRAEYIIEVKGMEDTGHEFLKLWLDRIHRTLAPGQWDAVIDKFKQNGLPLYMKLAFEEACRWRSYTPIPDLKPDIPGIIGDLLHRLSVRNNHGEVIVSRSLGYLAAAKNGLSEDEILDVLSMDEEVFNDFIVHARHTPPEKKLPVVVWSRLYLDLEPYLTERSADGVSLLSFYHRQFREAVERSYLGGNDKTGRHGALAQYFGEQNLVIDSTGTPNVRKVSELPFQLTYAGMVGALEKTLTDLLFIEAKFTAGLGYDLLADYGRVDALRKTDPPIRTAWYHNGAYGVLCPFCLATSNIDKGMLGSTIECPECGKKICLNPFTVSVEWHPSAKKKDLLPEQPLPMPVLSVSIGEFGDFVQKQIHTLNRYPRLTLQQAINLPSSDRVYTSARGLLGREPGRAWIEWTNRPQGQSPCIMTLSGHTSSVNACSFSPDGNLVISTSDDKMLKIWDAGTGMPIKTIECHSSLYGIRMSQDGTMIAVADCEAVVIYHRDSEAVSRLGGYANALAFSPDGGKLVTAAGDNTLKVWDTKTGAIVNTLIGHGGPMWDCSFSPDGHMIASTSSDMAITLRDADSGETISRLVGHRGHMTYAFSPDGRTIASASIHDKSLRMWDTRTGEQLFIITSKSLPADGTFDPVFFNIDKCCFSPDGRIIAAFIGQVIKLFDAGSGALLRTLSGHTSGIQSYAFSPDGRRIASASMDETLRIWDVDTGKTIRTLIGHAGWVNDCSFSPDGHRAATASNDMTLKIWSLDRGDATMSRTGHRAYITKCTFSPDGRKVITASLDHTLKLWDSYTDEVIQTLGGGFQLQHSKGVQTCAFSPDCTHIISAGDDFNVYVWDLEAGKVVHQLHNNAQLMLHSGYIKDCLFSPDGKYLVFISNEVIRILEFPSENVKSLMEGERYLSSCSLSPDGKRLLILSEFVRITDLASGQARTIANSDGVRACAFSPDGSRIVMAAKDNTIKVVDVETGMELLKILHTSRIDICMFSPDGSKIILSSSDRTLRIRDLGTGKEVGTFVFEGQIDSMHLAGSGDRIAAAGHDLYLLRLNGVEFNAPWVTPVRLCSLSGCPNITVSTDITARCKICGALFTLGDQLLDEVLSFKDRELNDGASGEKSLTTVCPHCQCELKLMPYVVDGGGKAAEAPEAFPHPGSAPQPSPVPYVDARGNLSSAASRPDAFSKESRPVQKKKLDGKPWWKFW